MQMNDASVNVCLCAAITTKLFRVRLLEAFIHSIFLLHCFDGTSHFASVIQFSLDLNFLGRTIVFPSLDSETVTTCNKSSTAMAYLKLITNCDDQRVFIGAKRDPPFLGVHVELRSAVAHVQAQGVGVICSSNQHPDHVVPERARPPIVVQDILAVLKDATHCSNAGTGTSFAFQATVSACGFIETFLPENCHDPLCNLLNM